MSVDRLAQLEHAVDLLAASIDLKRAQLERDNPGQPAEYWQHPNDGTPILGTMLAALVTGLAALAEKAPSDIP